MEALDEKVPLNADIAHTLAPVFALDESSQKVRMGTLWEDQPAVLFFIRYFG